MENQASIAKIKSELAEIKSRYRKKYGAVFFDIKVKGGDDVIVLEGTVLSEKQKNEAFLSVKDIVKNIKIEDKIKVLSDPEDNLQTGWAAVHAGLADIWAKLSGGKKVTGEIRASQALKGDFVRVLARKGRWNLVQTRDLAVGWLDSSSATASKWDAVRKEWMKTKRVRAGEMFKKRLAKNIQAKFMHFLKKYLNAPYVLGGMTEKGIDCSGLTERFYSDIFGIYLPRHSADQALCGGEVALPGMHFGDLVFLRKKVTKQAHIGVVVEKFETSKAERRNFADVLVLNARPEKGGAVIEELPDILKTYDLISIRRIIKEL